MFTAAGSRAKPRRPGTEFTLRRRSFTTSCADCRRSARGLSFTNSRPLLAEAFGPPWPIVLFTPSTAGWASTLRLSPSCSLAIVVKLTPSAAWVDTVIWPVSTSGMKPLGISRKNTRLRPTSSSERVWVGRGCRRA